MNTLHIAVEFKISKEGQLSNLRIVSSSGNALADKAALQAVENAAPFSGLPERDSYDEVIPFTFDSHIFNPRSE
jgi:TonB family protein